MRILAIETSCDETALAIVETNEASPPFIFRILADNTLSQIALHKEYGGVFPMMAKREHARVLVPLLLKTLKDAKLYKKTSRHVVESPLRKEFQEILDREPELFAQFITEIPYVDRPPLDAIAVTRGPGLEPALWVGINFAKALSLVWKIPIIPINHMEGHLLSALLQTKGEGKFAISRLPFPLLALLVSGGHTELILMRPPAHGFGRAGGWGSYEILGETKDDAAGEAFDKVARILGLPYPGGPEISRLGETGTPGVYPLPRPMLHSNDDNFSFSGLKTAVLYLTKKLARTNFDQHQHKGVDDQITGIGKEYSAQSNKNFGEQGTLSEQQKADIAREFEEACVEVLVTKTLRAAKEYGAKTIVMGGGVSANKRLRGTLLLRARDELSEEVTVHIPDPSLSTDNALMIAVAGLLQRERATMDISSLRADGNWRLDQNSF